MSKIIFYPKSKLVKEVIPPFQVCSVPDWYKTIPMYKDADGQAAGKLVVKDGHANYSLKSCMPFLDSMLTGYMLTLWCDVQVRLENGNTYLDWINQTEELAPVVSAPNPRVPSSAGHTPYVFSWKSQWGIKTPKGYSCILTHPFNREDLPFKTTTGVMDTDQWGIWGTQPFSLQEGWEGVIKAGTPLVQIIPFKRESWKSTVDVETGEGSLSEWANYEYARHSSKFRGYYKNNYWLKKEYK